MRSLYAGNEFDKHPRSSIIRIADQGTSIGMHIDVRMAVFLGERDKAGQKDKYVTQIYSSQRCNNIERSNMMTEDACCMRCVQYVGWQVSGQ